MSGGMIGVVADHAARYTWFNQSLAALEKPDNTTIEWRVGANRGASRNELARACVEQGRDWIFYVDDDQAFPPQTLNRLLSHGKPLVSALIVQRGKPFLPTAYATYADGVFHPLDLNSVGHDNLVRCAGVGSGGLLVRSEVFRDLPEPWFVYSEELGEDLYFSRLCMDRGIQRLVDTGCRIGHIIPTAIFATEDVMGDWAVGVQLSEGTKTLL